MTLVSSFKPRNIHVENSKSCEKTFNSTPFVLVLKKDEELFDGIIHCAASAKLTGASFVGIGALKNPTLAYYNLRHKKYYDKKITGIYELTSLSGNISMLNNKLNIHAHVVLGSATYNSFSGHLKRAKVGGTVEITIIPLNIPIIRKFDPVTGLNLLSKK